MKVKIIAEAGVNHNGKLSLAKKLALSAKKAGADYVKFQIFNVDEMALPNLKKTKYQSRNTKNKNENQFSMLKKLTLSKDDFNKLILYCRKIKIKFLASVFDNVSLKYLIPKSKIIKIGSSEVSNYFLLKDIGKFNKYLIISTGLNNYLGIKNALKVLIKYGQSKEKITLLHCNTAYPTPFTDANLLTIEKLKKLFKIDVGYSDHTVGYEAALASVVLGACIIEKHFTLNTNFKGPDHKISLNPHEFKKMVNGIRNLTKSLKVKQNKLTKSEKKNVQLVNKYIVARKNIRKGEKFSFINLTAKRTGGGIESMKIENLINRKSKRNFKVNEIIKI